MDTKMNDLIEELKGVVLDLHRSAGNLDQLIQAIEDRTSLNKDDNDDYLKAYVKIQSAYRGGFKIAHGYGSLDKKRN